MSHKPDDLCPRPDFTPPPATLPLAPPLYTSAVYRCDDPAQAEKLLAGELPGFAYSRDGHPNAVQLADKCRELHGAEKAAMCGSGMAAMTAALVSQLQTGDHAIVSNQLYGRSLQLATKELTRWGLLATAVDTSDLGAVRAALLKETKLIVVETISNPLLRVADVSALAELAHQHGAILLVDNTFASPALCRPIELGADLVLESLTKIMNGHSDVLLGLLCGAAKLWDRVPTVVSAWGLSAAPFDCWMALRGLGTLALRAERASDNALAAARWLAGRREVAAVHYPGLDSHADHALATRQFGARFGSVVTITLRGGRAAAEKFITAARQIPFCPSLGDLGSTLSHPASTSHRLLTSAERAALGIDEGTLRLSIGIESTAAIIAALQEALSAL